MTNLTFYTQDLNDQDIDWSSETVKPYEKKAIVKFQKKIAEQKKIINYLNSFSHFFKSSEQDLIDAAESGFISDKILEKEELIKELNRKDAELHIHKTYLMNNGLLLERTEKIEAPVKSVESQQKKLTPLDYLSIILIILLSIADGLNIFSVGKNLSNYFFLNLGMGVVYASALLYFSFITKSEMFLNKNSISSYSIYCALLLTGVFANFINKTGLNFNFDLYNLLKIIVLSFVPFTVVSYNFFNKLQPVKDVTEIIQSEKDTEIDELSAKKLRIYNSKLNEKFQTEQKLKEIEVINQKNKIDYEANKKAIFKSIINLEAEKIKIQNLIDNFDYEYENIENEFLKSIEDYRTFITKEFEFYGMKPKFLNTESLLLLLKNTNPN